jgi:tetratricopeptide (TPR) repeat protein
MNKVYTRRWLLNLLLIIFLAMASNAIATPYIKTDSSEAVKSLLGEAKSYHKARQFEQAAALLERALRIVPREPIIWHNLAGVRLAQADWKRAANLAQKSNALAGTHKKYKMLRIRNWMIITLACEGMEDFNCAREARNRAQAIARTLKR